MKKYICMKPCKFSGKEYDTGQSVPNEAIESKRVPALLRLGIIVAIDEPFGKDTQTAKKTGGKKAAL